MYIKWDALFCPCCGCRLRIRPRLFKHKAKLREQKQVSDAKEVKVLHYYPKSLNKRMPVIVADKNRRYQTRYFLQLGPRIKMKTSFLTNVTHIIRKWHFTAISCAFVNNAAFCTLMMTNLLLLFLLWQATTINTYSIAR